MKLVEFINGQGSQEWLDWREGGIGASDIPVIMGTNKFTTILKLWDKKAGFPVDEYVNSAMRHGTKYEPQARDWMNKNLGLRLVPMCIEDEKKSHFRASLDGYDRISKTLVEIKCPVKDQIINEARLMQRVPEYWMDQIQWQIMLVKPTRAILAIWDAKNNNCFTIECYKCEERQKYMTKEADEFWRKVQYGIQPKPSPSDYVVKEGKILKKRLDEYGEMHKMETTSKARKIKLKPLITEFGEGGNFLAYGYRITKCKPRISFNVDQMRLDGIEVDRYIKKSTSPGFYKIDPPKDL